MRKLFYISLLLFNQSILSAQTNYHYIYNNSISTSLSISKYNEKSFINTDLLLNRDILLNSNSFNQVRKRLFKNNYFQSHLAVGKNISKHWWHISSFEYQNQIDQNNYSYRADFKRIGHINKINLIPIIGTGLINTSYSVVNGNTNTSEKHRYNVIFLKFGLSLTQRHKIFAHGVQFYIHNYEELLEEDLKTFNYQSIDQINYSYSFTVFLKKISISSGIEMYNKYLGNKQGNKFIFTSPIINSSVSWLFYENLDFVPKFVF